MHQPKMASVGFSLCSTFSLPMISPFVLLKPSTNYLTYSHITKTRVTASSVVSSTSELVATEPAVSTTEEKRFGFQNLAETFWVDVQRAEGRPLNVKLNAPLSVASSRFEMVENVAVRVELSNGCVGWGEISSGLPSVTAGNQAVALVKVNQACEFLRQSPPMTLDLVLDQIGGILPGNEYASVRAGVEMALIDALANTIDVPLWRLFGGISNNISTAATIPAVSPAEAPKLASRHRKLGFQTFKLNVGKNIDADIEVLKAIRSAQPHCSFILDANEAYTSREAIDVLSKLCDEGLTPILFEQPVHRDDWTGLGHVSIFAKEHGASIAADESCRSLIDVQKIINENLTDVINIKLAKFGILGTLDIVKVARKSDLSLMIDSICETGLATGFAGHLAAGLGCFKYINLSTSVLFSEDPVVGGYKVAGANHKFTNARGQGGFLHWDILP